MPKNKSFLSRWRQEKGGKYKNFQPASETGFKVIKDDLWIAWYMNAYKDADGEYFANAAIEDNIEAMYADHAFPVLRRYHIPGTEHGKALAVVHTGKFAVAVGKFFDTELARKFKAFYETSPPQALSHGFYYEPHKKTAEGVFLEFRDFEISTLSPPDAANPYTFYAIEKGAKKSMAVFTEQAIEDLRNILGEALADEIIKSGERATKMLDEQGVSYKEKDAKAAPDTEEENAGNMEEETDVNPDLKESDVLNSIVEMIALRVADLLANNSEIEEETEDEEEAVAELELAKQVKQLQKEIDALKNGRLGQVFTGLLEDQKQHGQVQFSNTLPVENTARYFAQMGDK